MPTRLLDPVAGSLLVMLSAPVFVYVRESPPAPLRDLPTLVESWRETTADAYVVVLADGSVAITTDTEVTVRDPLTGARRWTRPGNSWQSDLSDVHVAGVRPLRAIDGGDAWLLDPATGKVLDEVHAHGNIISCAQGLDIVEAWVHGDAYDEDAKASSGGLEVPERSDRVRRMLLRFGDDRRTVIASRSGVLLDLPCAVDGLLPVSTTDAPDGIWKPINGVRTSDLSTAWTMDLPGLTLQDAHDHTFRGIDQHDESVRLVTIDPSSGRILTSAGVTLPEHQTITQQPLGIEWPFDIVTMRNRHGILTMARVDIETGVPDWTVSLGESHVHSLADDGASLVANVECLDERHEIFVINRNTGAVRAHVAGVPRVNTLHLAREGSMLIGEFDDCVRAWSLEEFGPPGAPRRNVAEGTGDSQP